MVVLLRYFTDIYFNLDGETGVNELVGELALLLASVVLVRCGFMSSKRNDLAPYTKYLFWGAGIVFFVAFGEEISWGQHFFKHQTPEWLAEINGQNETNFHNVNKKFFDRIQEWLMTLFAVTASLMHLFKKDKVLGFRVPEAPLVLCFMLIPIYRKFDTFNVDLWQLCFVFFWIYMIGSIVKKEKKLILLCLLFIITALIVLYNHTYHHHLFGANRNIFHEIRESVLSIVSFFYSIQLWCDLKNNPVKVESQV
jgi:preprotein translocase subunit SecG